MTASSAADFRQLKIHFDGLTVAQANIAAQELAKLLAPQLGPSGSVRVERTDQSRQDMGATIILLLGTPSAFAVAKGLHDYIAKRGSRVVIETPEGKVIATGDAASNIDVSKTVEAIRKYS